MAVEDNQSESTPLAPKSSHGEQAASSAPESSERPSLNFSEYWKLIHKTHEIDKDIAARVADKPFQSGNPKVWGVLTAISNRARKRKQGLNMVLKENVHFMGGLVEDYQFRIDSPFVSREHCKIYRQTFATEDDALKSQPLVFLKDISSNGTYVNRIRYTRRDKAVQIHHGDMISFVKPLCHDLSFTFMFREGLESDASSNGVLAKSKPAEELACEIKRVKGVGLGAPEGAICLDDFCSMQLSNAELRKKLEDGGVTMDKLQNENRASIVHHRTVSQKRGLSETTEIMDDRSRWGEAEAGNWLVGRSNDEDDGGSDEELFKPLSEEESMSSCCPPESEEEEDDEEEDDICSLDSNTRKIDYEDSDSEESGEEVVSELREFRLHRKHKHLSDDEREFGFDSDGLLVIESESSAIKELLVKQEDDEEEEEESMGSSIPNSCSSSSSSSQTTYFGVTAAAALNSSSLLIMRKKKRRKKSMMSSVMSSYSLHSYFGLPTEEDSKKKKKTISSVPSVQCCYYGLSINSQKKKKKTISSVTTFQSVHSSGHDVESGDELVSTLVWPPKQAVV